MCEGLLVQVAGAVALPGLAGQVGQPLEGDRQVAAVGGVAGLVVGERLLDEAAEPWGEQALAGAGECRAARPPGGGTGLLLRSPGQVGVIPRDHRGGGLGSRGVVGAEPGEHVQAPLGLVIGLQAEHGGKHGPSAVVLACQDPGHELPHRDGPGGPG